MRLLALIVVISTLFFASVVAAQATDEPQVIVRPTPMEGDFQKLRYVTANTIYVLTNKLFNRTADGGATWADNSILPHCDAVKCVAKMVPAVTDRRLTILQGSGERHWVIHERDVDTGITAAQIDEFTFANVNQFIPHPTLRQRLLAVTKDNKAYVSDDLGKNWRFVLENFKHITWQSNLTSGYEPHTLIFSRYSSTSKKVPVTIVSFDIITKTQRELRAGQDFFYINKFLFVASQNVESQVVSLHVSTDNGLTFRKAKLPLELTESSYTVLDTTEGSVFLNVHHNQKDNEPWGHVYRSDFSGSRYSVSLLNNRRIESYCDFQRIKSLEGIYVANLVDNPEDSPCVECKGAADCQKKCNFISKISFDKGNTWKRITPPKVGVDGEDYTACIAIEECSLHLHGMATGNALSPLFSTSTAVGLIMANGNIGPHLQPREGTVNTYLSRDGGLTWEEIAKGSHVFKFADHGGLMLIAKNLGETNEIKYSWDQGLTWASINITAYAGSPMVINRITAGPDPLTKTFLVRGHRANDLMYKPMFLQVDFSKFHTAECKLMYSPNDPLSDYETFKPKTYSKGCLLGREVEYTRRKRTSKCFNPQKTDRQTNIRHCPCVPQDFECDFGYQREGNSLQCLPISAAAERRSKAAPAICKGYYNESRGYIKEAGNSCVGGVELDPIMRPCPNSRSSIVGGLLLAVFALLIMGFLGYYGYHRSDRLKRFFNDRMPAFARNIRYHSLIPPFGVQALGIGGGAASVNRVSVSGNETTHEFGFDDEDEEEDAEIAEGDNNPVSVDNTPAVKSATVTAQLRGPSSTAAAAAATSTTTSRSRPVFFDDDDESQDEEKGFNPRS